MEVFRLLQIGDLHFPDADNSVAPIDSKDAGFPGRVVQEIGVAPLQTVCKRLSTLIEEHDPDVLCFMGDYTTRGDPRGLTEGLAYLRRQIPAAWAGKLATRAVTLIGNHDINRLSLGDAQQRFDDINAELAASGLPVAATAPPSRVEWRGREGQTRVFGVNSCLGCGETRHLSYVIQDTVAMAIRSLAASGPDPALLDQLIESLDTPAISESAVGDLLREIATMDINAVPIVCAHHNLLPQATPRIAPYTELMNGGSLRRSLRYPSEEAPRRNWIKGPHGGPKSARSRCPTQRPAKNHLDGAQRSARSP